ncbi:hypothetical protein [Candidatus Halobonum tyrrellensis]|uniref:DUF7967 domain-containing protein n=1 Tax=Candidatus Halobonum tyrrellensis G22 TaxID=1324957 RepID=V4HNN9_9EURY|nr:hypothetical protein [Candidatus Halobonum tyrrellensis]ESP89539.1 hypothetical protein K933_03245 [Candidatus Halobonum tyrrellensis G22]
MRLWLVEREYDTRQTVTLVYATPDGERRYRRQASVELLSRNPATAAVERDGDDAEAVTDAETRERYAAEASRMADRHGPDDEV